ncbi:hypothetical protein PLIIFM63780_001325 [Purpureocillium lilacinum]|nr:hypothetical protein PLIIFM63780_001325 [Purpureocillium lilacinum]
MPDDAIPEPIVEEPESPPSSPTVRAINLIEYHPGALSDVSTEDEDEPPEIEEITSALDSFKSPQISLADSKVSEAEVVWA